MPKSVSVVYALGDPLVHAEVVEAGEEAVPADAGLVGAGGVLRPAGHEQPAGPDPRPEAWGTRRLPGLGFVAARFRHRTSRAGDPQLHWHVLVANISPRSGWALVGVGRHGDLPVQTGGGSDVPGGAA